MSWAINEPSNFGEFWFDGDFVGWREALLSAFDENITGQEKEQYNFSDVPKYIFGVSQKFVGITKHEIDHPRAMEPLREFEQPKHFQFQYDRSKRYGSLVKLTSRLMAVDAALKSLIEELEPNLHQFWPMELRLPDGSVLEKQYFGMRVRQFIDSFLPDESGPDAFNDAGGTYYIFAPTKKYVNRLTVSRKIIGDSHVWRERKLKTPELFFSEELVNKIEKSGLRIPPTHKLSER